MMSGRKKVIWNSGLAQENVDDETIFEGFDIWLHCLSGWRSSQLATVKELLWQVASVANNSPTTSR